MKTLLGPILHRDEYTRWIEREANAWLDEAVFAPLDAAMEGERLNENDNHSFVAAALIAGTIWYASGVFGGEFDSKISRELRTLGATLTAEGTFRLPAWKLSIPVRSAIAYASHRSRYAHGGVVTIADTILDNVKKAVLGIGAAAIFLRILDDLEIQSRLALDHRTELPVAIGKPVSSAAQEREFDDRLKKITATALEDLKKKVADNLADGGRPDKLKAIVETWKTKLRSRIATEAEHQAAVVVTAHRRELARRLGISEYIWQTMEDSKVRKCHRLLNGKTFNWDNPPIIDDRTGFRGNPGESANCRCHPRLILVEAQRAA